ncbi:MAG: hypothetical protein OJF60_003188 [Burkholderiaceae bacterium]|nr:MAG: hypothetical protein OJF60_003188 [Burkholderiaceae bacterium]
MQDRIDWPARPASRGARRAGLLQPVVFLVMAARAATPAGTATAVFEANGRAADMIAHCTRAACRGRPENAAMKPIRRNRQQDD